MVWPNLPTDHSQLVKAFLKARQALLSWAGSEMGELLSMQQAAAIPGSAPPPALQVTHGWGMLGCKSPPCRGHSAAPCSFWGVQEPWWGTPSSPTLGCAGAHSGGHSAAPCSLWGGKGQQQSQFRPQLTPRAGAELEGSLAHAQLTLLPWDNQAARPSPPSY